MSQPFGRNLIQESHPQTSQSEKVAVKLRCPEGWREVAVKFDTDRWETNFPCNVLYYLEQPKVGHYKGILEIGGFLIEISGRAGRELDVLVLGRDFLDEYKPWSYKGKWIEVTINTKRILIE